MKSNFKIIIISIIFTLSCIFLFQLYWLKGLYNTIKEETNGKIQECMAEANMDEIQFRLDSLERESKKEERGSVSISWSFTDKKDNQNKASLHKKKFVKHNADTLYTVEHEEPSEAKLKDMSELLIIVREAIHQAIDSILPVQPDSLTSFANKNIQKRHINTHIYGVDIIQVDTDSILQSNMSSNIDKKDVEMHTFVFDSKNKLAYRFYLAALTKDILYQMSGILSSTVLIVLVLGFAFWYLIRTIVNLKTLEQMKDDFTNNMTHELKTPIAVAYSATDALLNFGHGDNKKRREKYLTICKEQLSDLSERVEQILAMSMERRQSFSLDKEEIRIADMIDNLTSQFKLKYENEKRINYHIDIDPKDMAVRADRTHLNNIISNLIDNAIKYASDNVTINITIRQGEKEDLIEVSDNGVGIAADKLPYIFDKFYRVTDGNKYGIKGYGLGLFYVKTMIEKHGGSIAVKSEVNKGTKFSIILPQ